MRARRAELRADRAVLLAGHRVELRQCVTASRLAASADLAEALAGLGRELRHHAAGRTGPVGQCCRRWRAAVGRLVDRVVAGWVVGLLQVYAALPLRAAAGRAVVARGHRRRPGGRAGAAPSVRRAARPRPSGRRGAGAARGRDGGTWRLALLPAAVLPAVGLPAVGGRAVLPPAVGIGLALLSPGLGRTGPRPTGRGCAGGRTRSVATVRAALDTELARRAIEVERVAGAELDELVARRLARVDVELRALAPGGS